jgi:hypothetical protein
MPIEQTIVIVIKYSVKHAVMPSTAIDSEVVHVLAKSMHNDHINKLIIQFDK